LPHELFPVKRIHIVEFPAGLRSACLALCSGLIESLFERLPDRGQPEVSAGKMNGRTCASVKAIGEGT
jgi:hypothetical protein